MTDKDQPEFTVRKFVHYMPVNLLGLDEQGRQQYVCPSRGCGETAYFDADGVGHCPVDEAIHAFLVKAMASLERNIPEALGMSIDPEFIPVHDDEVRRE